MKCIKSVKALKNYEIGDVVRINNIEAEEKVRTGYWQYAPKSEWKAKSKVETQSEKNDGNVPKMKASERNTKKSQKEKK